MRFYRKYIDFTNPSSVNYKLRQLRLRLFLDLAAGFERPVNVLDVGGSVFYWRHLFFGMPNVDPADYRITVTNVSESELKKSSGEDGFNLTVADARAMPQFADGQFDVVHSNSVIEHVGDLGDMLRMGKEVSRIGKAYFVQTPNFWFPIEPHFRAVGFHWLPRSMRLNLVRRWKFGAFSIAKSDAEAELIVDSARLLTRDELEACFPDARIFVERVCGFTKSFVAYRPR